MMVRQKIGFVSGRDMQHMEAMPMPDRQVDRPLSGDQGGAPIANAGMVGHVAGVRKPLHVGADRLFVLAVRRDRQGRFGEDAFERRLLVDQQVPGARTDEDLDSRSALGRLKLGDIVGRRPDVKTVVDQTGSGGDRQFLFEPFNRDRGGTRVGHL